MFHTNVYSRSSWTRKIVEQKFKSLGTVSLPSIHIRIEVLLVLILLFKPEMNPQRSGIDFSITLSLHINRVLTRNIYHYNESKLSRSVKDY